MYLIPNMFNVAFSVLLNVNIIPTEFETDNQNVVNLTEPIAHPLGNF